MKKNKRKIIFKWSVINGIILSINLIVGILLLLINFKYENIILLALMTSVILTMISMITLIIYSMFIDNKYINEELNKFKVNKGRRYHDRNRNDKMPSVEFNVKDKINEKRNSDARFDRAYKFIELKHRLRKLLR